MDEGYPAEPEMQ